MYAEIEKIHGKNALKLYNKDLDLKAKKFSEINFFETPEDDAKLIHKQIKETLNKLEEAHLHLWNKSISKEDDKIIDEFENIKKIINLELNISTERLN